MKQLGEVALSVEKVAAVGVGAVVGSIIGSTFGQIFDFVAGGDIILPASKTTINFTDRGVATHEYGHFALCNLLNATSPIGLAVSYDEAAADGFITGQAPSATGAVINEAFADFFVSQVARGTNYAQPPTNSFSTGSGMTYCSANVAMPASACIEDNATNLSPLLPNGDGFERNVRRYVGLFVDAFDGGPVNPPVFGGLSDAMIDNLDNWCARCEVFRLHTQDPTSMNAICPEAWVGRRPTFNIGAGPQSLTCTFEGCPPGTTANATTRSCDPPCPNPATQHFDPFLLECITSIIVE